jgi:hypothetical protein
LKMGFAGRYRFENNFTYEHFENNLNEVLLDISKRISN